MEDDMRMRTGLFLLVFTAILAGLSAVAQAQERRITVVGEGRVLSVPDIAYVTLGVSEEARTAGEALAAMSIAGEAILARVAAAGIEPRHVQTSGLNLWPVHDHSSQGRPKVVGFAASTEYTIRVDDLEGLGGLLDEIVSAGANQLNGVRFDVSDPRPMEDAARRDAVLDARAKAELFADAAGVTLGEVVTLDEIVSGGRPMPMMEMRMMDAASDGVPLAEGEVAVEARVTMVFAIAG